MATLYKDPTGDIAGDFSGTWSGSAGTRYALVDDYPDSSGADYLTCSAAGYGAFSYTGAFAVPAGATAISVQVLYYDRKNGSQASGAAGRLVVGGTG